MALGKLARVALGVGGAGGLAAVAVVVLAGGGDGSAATSAAVTVVDRQVARSEGDDEFVPAVSGDELTVGDRLRTDSTGSAQLDFADGSLARLGPDTVFELTALDADAGERKVGGRLDVGSTWHQVEDLTGTEDDEGYTVETAVATASVRGTALAVVCPERETCTITVQDGEVEVAPAIGESLRLEAGQAVTVMPEGAGGVQSLSPDELLGDPWIRQNLAADAGGGEVVAPPLIEGDWAIEATTVESPGGARDGETVTRTHRFELVGCDQPPCELEVVIETASDSTRVPVSFDGTRYAYEASFPVACGDVADALTTTVRWTFQVTADELSAGLRRATELEGTISETQVSNQPSDCQPSTLRHELHGVAT